MSVLRLKIWEVVQLFAQITEQQSRDICQEFVDATLTDISIDDFADETSLHMQFLEHMQEICREPMIYGLDLTQTEPANVNGNGNTGDPFFYSRKVLLNELDQYIQPVSQAGYYCTICCDTYDTVGYKVSCDNRNNNCTFCKECISKWITENVAKCPNCWGTLRGTCAPP
jgi:hypothetical protein